ncbi:MAG: SIR2 family protein [Candidatus Zhuqueibacterota bacterium]
MLNTVTYTEDNVGLPIDLINALSKDELVIFVGAGISTRADPQQRPNTFYPTFKELCNQIQEKLAIKTNDNEKKLFNRKLYDQVLGIWNDQHKPIHQTAAEILSKDEQRKRIVLHKAIVNLFPRESTPRIITTNFDNLLNRAIDESEYLNNEKWVIHEAPSFPPAIRFKGIGYLHGHVSNPEEMILSDKDIGRAYMDEGWALKFAHELFKHYAILFIGYSLNDPPLRYLSLALEGSKSQGAKDIKPKWALIPKEDNINEIELDWRRRGVYPIFYPIKKIKRKIDHRALERTLVAWGEDNRRGFIDRRNVLSEIAKSNPTELPNDKYTRALLYFKTPELLRDFAQFDLHEGWFDIFLSRGYLENILKQHENLKELDYFLAEKIIGFIISDVDKWILKLSPFHETMHPILFDTFSRLLDKDNLNIMKYDLRKIVELFKVSIQNNKNALYFHRMENFFKLLIEFNLYDDAIWLLISILKVEIKIRRSFESIYAEETGDDKEITSKIEAEVEYIGQMQDYYFKEYYERFFKPNVTRLGYQLLVHLTNKLRDFQITLERFKPRSYTYIRRPNIEVGETYSHTAIDLVIDTIVEVWKILIELNVEKAILVYQMWQQIKDPYFKRLSIFALKKLIEGGYVK